MSLSETETLIILIHIGVGFQRDQGALQAKVQSLFEQDNSDVLFQAASLGDGTVIREFLCKFPNEVFC